MRAAAANLAAFGSGDDLSQARSEFASSRARFVHLAHDSTDLLARDRWEQIGGTLAILDRLVDDLTVATPPHEG